MITANDIRGKQFDSKRGRYDGPQVDLFLIEVANAFEKLAAENDALKKQNETLTAQAEQYANMEDALRGALINAQKLADETVAQARLDAQEITAQADAQANAKIENIVSQAQAEREALKDMKAIVAGYKQQVRELMSKQLDLLEQYCKEE